MPSVFAVAQQVYGQRLNQGGVNQCIDCPCFGVINWLFAGDNAGDIGQFFR